MHAVSRIACLVLFASASLWVPAVAADPERPAAPPPSEADCGPLATQIASNKTKIARLESTNGYLWRVVGNSDPTVRFELSRNAQSIADLQAKNDVLHKEAEACGPTAAAPAGGK